MYNWEFKYTGQLIFLASVETGDYNELDKVSQRK